MGKRLIVIAGKETGQTFELPEEGTLLLGRGPETHTRFTDLSVSRDHCRVHVKAGQVEIADSGKSAIGTFVNNQPVAEVHPLRPGDVIRLGESTQLRLELDAEDIFMEQTVPGDRIEFLRRLAREAEETSGKARGTAVRSQPQEGIIQVSCACGQELHAREKYAGSSVRCPSCKAILSLPGRPALAQPVDAPARPRTTGGAKPSPARSNGKRLRLPNPLAVGVVMLTVAATVCLGVFWWQQGQETTPRERPARKAVSSNPRSPAEQPSPEKKY